jgi:Carboxypeptidase regulatory-like domain
MRFSLVVRAKRVLLFALLLTLITSGTSHRALCFAQSTNAAVGGQITDEQGRVVPGVTVVLTNLNTGVPYEAKTNGDGLYNAPNLPPGIYRANVKKDGFKSIVKGDIELHVQDNASINFQLQIGSVSETVTVEAGGLVINTTDATVATVIDRNFAENLPLNGRSFQTLILLTPGTVLTPQIANGNGGTFSVNGQRANANNFTIDGVSANGGGFLSANVTPVQMNGANPNFTIAGTTQGLVAVDALQEFKIQTSTYAPEFGLQPGGQVSLLTRSGTNALHGTAFDYFRNNVLDANNWFNDQKGLPRGVERQNDFGGTVGGPILKDKTFFFFSYEGLRLLQPVTEGHSVPSLRERQEATPTFQGILNSFPIPDLNGDGVTYTLSASFPRNLDSYMIKVDQALGKWGRLFGKFDESSSFTRDIGADVNTTVTQKIRSRGVTLGVDVSLQHHLQSELRVNYGVNVSSGISDLYLVGGAKTFDTSILFPSPLIASRGDLSIFSLVLSDVGVETPIGSEGKISQRQINILDSLSYSFGSHQLKWGINYRRLFPTWTRSPLGAQFEVDSDSDLMNGDLTTARSVAYFLAHPIYTNFSAFAEDTWRMSARVTMTYGLRWELNPAPGERDGIQPLNLSGLDNPSTATLAPPNSPLYQTTYNNFAPRVGIAYQLRQSAGRETVVRGGFGVFYDLNSETAAVGFARSSFNNASPFQNEVPFPVASNVLTIPTLPRPLTPPYSNIAAVDPNLRLPYTLQWNVSIEQALGHTQSLTASYVGAAGYRLLRTDALFNINPNFLYVTEARNASSSNYESLQLQFNRQLSHGLQALAAYTYSHAIDNSSYAESALGQGRLSQSSGATFVDPNIDRGSSDFDLRHALRGALTYNVPVWNANALSRAVLGGWSFEAIGSAQSGLPVDLVGGNYRINGVGASLRPNVVVGQPLYVYGAQCVAAHNGIPCPGGMGFNPAAFTRVPTDSKGNPTQTQGTLGRNVLRGFGAWQMDFALHRQFNLTERVNLQFRSEFFNIFNHPSFGAMNNNLGQGSFGLVQSTLNRSFGGLNQLYQIGGPRSIQLALKLSF